MRNSRFGEVKVRTHVQPEGVIPLFVADLLKIIVRHLVGGVADQNVDASEFSDSALNHRATV